MIDNDEVSDADLVRLVAEKDHRLAAQVQARLRRLRLERVREAPRAAPPSLWAAVRHRLGLQ